MNVRISVSRALVAGLMAALLGTSGCSWLRKSDKLYAQDPAQRPLEVPPALELPKADSNLASGGSVTASQVAAGRSAGTALGFTLQGSRDEAFRRVGERLGTIEGLGIASRAQLLGVFDVNYQGSNFLLRVSEVEGGVYVSAVDPRGQPASGEAAERVVSELKTALGGR